MGPLICDRKIDKLGRIVLPHDFLQILGFNETTAIRIALTEDASTLTAAKPICTFCGSDQVAVTVEHKGVCPQCLSKLKALF